MKIHISKNVRTLLPKEKHQFILTANDGSNPFSSSEGCCTIGDRFLLVGTETLPSDYKNLFKDGEDRIYTSDYDLNFLSGTIELVLNEATGRVILQNEEGYLDDNLTIELLY